MMDSVQIMQLKETMLKIMAQMSHFKEKYPKLNLPEITGHMQIPVFKNL